MLPDTTTHHLGFNTYTAPAEADTISFDEARRILDELAATPINAQEKDFGKGVLLGLQAHKKHVYQGTADPAAVARRRAANKRARQSRVANRRKASR